MFLSWVFYLFCIWLIYRNPGDDKSSTNATELNLPMMSTNLTSAEKIEIRKVLEESVATFNGDSEWVGSKCPGFSWNLCIKLNHPQSGRNNFIADSGERFDQNRISIFLDADRNLCFRVIGQKGAEAIEGANAWLEGLHDK